MSTRAYSLATPNPLTLSDNGLEASTNAIKTNSLNSGLLASAVIFSDDFNSDSLLYNKTSFIGGWTVTNGSVDLIGEANGYGYFPLNGNYIDLDGTTFQAGYFTKSLDLLAGMTYTASFQLAGNHRDNIADTVEVSFGNSTQSYVIASSAEFSSYSITFSPSSSGSFSLTFHNLGDDNIGALLDNVIVESSVFTDITPPVITGIEPTIVINDTATATPFSTLTVTDESQVAASISIDDAAKGVFTTASLAASGFSSSDGGLTYTHPVGTPSELQTAIQALVYQPTANRVAVGSTETTTFTISISDTSANTTTVIAPEVVSVSVNDAPTLTTFSNVVATGNEDQQLIVNFADLLVQGDEADVDVGNTVNAFVVKAVSSGHLKIGLSAATATDWNALSNNTIDATHYGYWTPDFNANGTLVAFTVVAKDDGGLESTTPIQATVDVLAVSDVNVTAGITPVEGGTTGTFLISLDSPAPIGGLTVNYTLAGSASLVSDYEVTGGDHITVMTSNNFTIAEGQTSATLNVNALTDNVSDPNETVTLNLKTGTGYQLAQSAVTSFAPKVDYATSSGPRGLNVGDFNNDGQMDLAVVNAYSNTVSVLLRNAANDGFDAKVDYNTGSGPDSVDIGDFNGDGKLDLVVANFGDNTVSVLLGNETGFDDKVDYATGGQPFSVSVGDFNGDGKLDLMTANWASNTVSVLMANATGFDEKVDYPVGLGPHDSNVGDFNGDDKLDLVIVNQFSDTVSVLLRNADNTDFDPKVDYATTGPNPHAVGVGDFNGDGKLDLAVANMSSHTVSVLLRNADNTGFEPKVDYATGLYPFAVSVGDFNNDSKPDLAVANMGGNTVSILLGNATGFADKVDYVTTDERPTAVKVADFNNDGKLDFTVTNIDSDTVSVFLNNSNPSATLSINQPVINHAPILNKPETINYTDTAFDDCFPTVTGTLIAHDLDGDTLTYYVGPADGGISAGQDDGNGTMWMTNAYGTLTITKATGEYNFVANDAAIEALTTDKNTYFTVVVSDGVTRVSQALSINFVQKGVTESLHNDVLTGTRYADKFDALAGNDTIYALEGNDTINGGAGADRMIGGKGDDSYYVDDSGDVVKETRHEGEDTVFTHISYTLTDHVENIVVIGTDAVTAQGNALNNHLTGNGAGSVLDGQAGHDNYYVDKAGDTIAESANNGWDTVISSIDYRLEDNLEELYLTGTENLQGNGNAQNNNLHGNSGDNYLDGGLGADFMAGGAGNDTYIVDHTGDVIKERANEGIDSVYSHVSYTLPAHVENLHIDIEKAPSSILVGTGNELNNHLTVEGRMYLSANAILYGLGGDDSLSGNLRSISTLVGGTGNDTYTVCYEDDVIKEYANEGIDTVFSHSVSYTLTDHVENLILGSVIFGYEGVSTGIGNALANQITGNSHDNVLEGRAGDDMLLGGEGADVLIGGRGQDHYDLTETTPATDTVRITKGESLINSHDVISGFHVGNDLISTAGVDKLDLDSNRIALDTIKNGKDAGNIHSHRIHDGIINFDDMNHYQNALNLTDHDLDDVFAYLQNNIKNNETVAFVCEGNTFVFQDGGSQDTLVELIGITANSLNTTGLAADAIWLV